MAFTTYDITTNNGLVRFNLGDTDPTPGKYIFEDEEIDAMLTRGGSVDAATGLCIRALMAHRGLRSKYAAAHGLTIDDRHILKDLKVLLGEYGGSVTPTMGVVDSGLMPGDVDYTDPVRS